MGDRSVGDLEGRTFKVSVPPMPPLPKEWNMPGARILPETAYVTLNRDGAGRIVEVFLTFKRNNAVQGLVNALCRLASLALRHGVSPDRVAEAMRGQRDALPPVWWPGGPPRGGAVLSVADALARLIETADMDAPGGDAP